MRTKRALIGAMVLAGTGLLAVADDPPRAAPATPAGTAKAVTTTKVQAKPAAPEARPAAAPAPAPVPVPGPATPSPKPAPAAEAASPAAPAASAEEKPIVEAVEAFANAYNAPDVEALASQFTDDAVVVDPSGSETRGRTAIAEMYAASFTDVPGLRLESSVQEVRFVTPDVARVEGQSRLSTGTGDATEFTRFSVLMVRREGKWLANELREYRAAVADVTPFERLKELAWMVGDWVDESDENKVSASVRWADNQSYLVRTYKVEIKGEKASSGTMFIGWDPQSGQIKSWLFDSQGGHGEGLWTRVADNEWIVKASGVLRDGRPTSATQIHTILNKDAVKTSSIDRIIGGQVANDIRDVLMVRKAPPPGVAVARPGDQPAAKAADVEGGEKPANPD